MDIYYGNIKLKSKKNREEAIRRKIKELREIEETQINMLKTTLENYNKFLELKKEYEKLDERKEIILTQLDNLAD